MKTVQTLQLVKWRGAVKVYAYEERPEPIQAPRYPSLQHVLDALLFAAPSDPDSIGTVQRRPP
jgi:hypothetical protein